MVASGEHLIDYLYLSLSLVALPFVGRVLLPVPVNLFLSSLAPAYRHLSACPLLAHLSGEARGARAIADMVR